MTRANLCYRRRSRGAALIVGLVFLLILTMLGITAIQTSTLEERMAGNARDVATALQAAEIALRAAEALAAAGSLPSTGGYDTTANSPAPDPADPANWTTSNAAQLTGVTFSGNTAATAPLYWIEARNEISTSASVEIPSEKDARVYFNTARSTGASGASQVVLQSVFLTKTP